MRETELQHRKFEYGVLEFRFAGIGRALAVAHRVLATSYQSVTIFLE